MNKKMLVVSAVLVILIVVIAYFIKRQDKHSLTFKAPSGKTATITVE